MTSEEIKEPNVPASFNVKIHKFDTAVSCARLENVSSPASKRKNHDFIAASKTSKPPDCKCKA